MTSKEWFRLLVKERRAWPRGSAEWDWRTRAARKHYWLVIGKPTCEWPE